MRYHLYVILFLEILVILASRVSAEEKRLLMPNSRAVLPTAEIAAANAGMASSSLRSKKRQLKSVAHAAFDDVAFIVHKSNSVQDVSRQEVIDIYAGKVRTWREVGGQNSFIWVVNEEEGRTAFGVFKRYFTLTGKFLRNAVVIGPNRKTIQSVAANPHAIGYVTLGAAMTAEAKGVKIKRLILDGAEGPVVTARNEFPESMRLQFPHTDAPAGLRNPSGASRT